MSVSAASDWSRLRSIHYAKSLGEDSNCQAILPIRAEFPRALVCLVAEEGGRLGDAVARVERLTLESEGKWLTNSPAYCNIGMYIIICVYVCVCVF